jgi:hypothetical protein
MCGCFEEAAHAEARKQSDRRHHRRRPLLFNPQAQLLLGVFYLGYLNSGASFSASLVVFIDASHLLSLLS